MRCLYYSLLYSLLALARRARRPGVHGRPEGVQATEREGSPHACLARLVLPARYRLSGVEPGAPHLGVVRFRYGPQCGVRGCPSRTVSPRLLVRSPRTSVPSTFTPVRVVMTSMVREAARPSFSTPRPAPRPRRGPGAALCRGRPWPCAAARDLGRHRSSPHPL